MTAIDRLRHTVAALCAPDTAGRAAGSPEGAAARGFLSAAFANLGLAPGGEHGYLQLLPATAGANLLGVIPGDAPGWVVLGAHYDHLGTIAGKVHWGADDNASGVATMLEVAHRLVAAPRRGRSVLISAYDAEEPPWFRGPDMGSQWWVDHPTVPLEAVNLMVCLDIVGHAVGPPGAPAAIADTVFVAGADLAPGLDDAVRVPEVTGIAPRAIADWVEEPMSDHHAFRAAGIPHLFYTCARSAVYHTPRDRPELLDFAKMAALADHLTGVIGAARSASPGAWSFDPEGASDHTTVATMLALTTAMPDGLFEDVTAALEPLVGRTRIDEDDRAWICALVGAFEAQLG